MKNELTNFIPHPSAFILLQRRPVNSDLRRFERFKLKGWSGYPLEEG
jgi:hypothetical protein